MRMRMAPAAHDVWSGAGGGDLAWFGLGLVLKGAAALYNATQADLLAHEAREQRRSALRAADAQLTAVFPRQQARANELKALARRRVWRRGQARRAQQRALLSMPLRTAVRMELAAA